jgi:hypothetical protein
MRFQRVTHTPVTHLPSAIEARPNTPQGDGQAFRISSAIWQGSQPCNHQIRLGPNQAFLLGFRDPEGYRSDRHSILGFLGRTGRAACLAQRLSATAVSAWTLIDSASPTPRSFVRFRGREVRSAELAGHVRVTGDRTLGCSVSTRREKNPTMSRPQGRNADYSLMWIGPGLATTRLESIFSPTLASDSHLKSCTSSRSLPRK